MTDKIDKAIEVLERSREQLIAEIATCGSAGGVGRAQNYAPVFVQTNNALEALYALRAPKAEVADRMANMRAAKAAKQAQEG